MMFDLQLAAIAQLRTNSPEKFKYQQPVTPQPLIQEITANLVADKAASVLVLFTVEWALYLREIGFTNIVVSAITDPTIAKACAVFGLKYQELSEIEENNMKFDVVVGNPPYQNGDNSNFYREFVSLAKQLSDNVALVVPSSMFKDLSEFNHLTHYSFKGTAFAGIQIVASWFIWRKSHTGDCVVLFPNGEIFAESQFFIAPTTDLNQFRLVNRLLKDQYLGISVQMGKLSRNKVIHDDNGVMCIWSAGRKGQDFDCVKVANSLVSQLSGIGLHKVVFSGDYTTTAIGPTKYAKPEYGCALKAHFVEVSSYDEAMNLIMYLNSKFVKYIIPVIKGTSTKNGKTVFKLIPKIDLTRQWTDAELYKHFNLTQEEIDLIESTVK